MSSFQFSDFELIADELAAQGGEGKLRVAVSRLYYALFHLAKVRTKAKWKKGSIHALVVSRVKRKDWPSGDQLDMLRRYRVDADYRLAGDFDEACGDWDKDWKKVRFIAAHIRPKLDKL